jgi:hypothetical protein
MRPRSTVCIVCGVGRGVAAFQLYPSASFRFRRDPFIQLDLSNENINDDKQDGGGLEQLKNTLTFRQLDINSDGKVSLSELKMGLEQELKVCRY